MSEQNQGHSCHPGVGGHPAEGSPHAHSPKGNGSASLDSCHHDALCPCLLGMGSNRASAQRTRVGRTTVALKPLELTEMPQLRDPRGTRSQPVSRDTQREKEPVELREGCQHPGRASRRERSFLPLGHRAPGPADPACPVPATSEATGRSKPSACSCLG